MKLVDKLRVLWARKALARAHAQNPDVIAKMSAKYRGSPDEWGWATYAELASRPAERAYLGNHLNHTTYTRYLHPMDELPAYLTRLAAARAA